MESVGGVACGDTPDTPESLFFYNVPLQLPAAKFDRECEAREVVRGGSFVAWNLPKTTCRSRHGRLITGSVMALATQFSDL